MFRVRAISLANEINIFALICAAVFEIHIAKQWNETFDFFVVFANSEKE